MSQLTAQLVRELSRQCGRQIDEARVVVEVEAVRHTFCFVQELVEAQRPAIDALLAQLPVGFRASSYGGGGGWTFLNACYTESEVHWGEHADVELLLALGLAIGSVQWLLPREMWDMLPGGMPYFQILPPQTAVTQ